MQAAAWIAMVVLVVAVTPSGRAQSDGGQTVGFRGAEVLEQFAPRYPIAAATSGREGWVVLSYIVDKQGAVAEPMIEDSSGNELLEEAAMRAVERWRYKPATLNGEPIEQAMTRTRLSFRLEGVRPGARPSFARAFKKLQGALAAKDYETAGKLLADLRYQERMNLYEDAWFWWGNALYLDASKRDDTFAVRESLRRAIGYEEDYLPPDSFLSAAERLFLLDAQALDFSAALATFARVQSSREARKSNRYEQSMAAFELSAQQIRGLIDSDRELALQARIGEHGYWVHDLLRRSFSLGNIKGNLEELQIRCERGSYVYEPQPMTWIIPESWGTCGAYVRGQEGASFTFYEHPAAQSHPPANR